jgi:hypothetical protein
MRQRVRRPILAGLIAVVAALLAAGPAFAATSISINSATASGPAQVGVNVTYACDGVSTVAEMAVLVFDITALAVGQSSVTPTCDGVGHTTGVAVPVMPLLPLRTVRPGDLTLVNASLVDVHGQVVGGATATRTVTLG